MEAAITQPQLTRPAFDALSDKQIAAFLKAHAAYVASDDDFTASPEKLHSLNRVFDRKVEDFAAALQLVSKLDQEWQEAGEGLKVFPQGPMGLIPDHVRATPEFKSAFLRFERAHKALRDFNGPFTKKFKKELAEHRNAIRQAKWKANSKD